MSDAEKWDARYRASAAREVPACLALREHAHLLPPAGEALDLACGLGGNALALARHGLTTSAWDVSREAIERLRQLAAAAGLRVAGEARDAVARPPAPGSFDVIVVSRFLERGLCPYIAAALRPGGLVYYQTFVRDKPAGVGPSNPDYLLGDNELLALFAGLQVLVYHDEGTLGDTGRGVRNESLLIARRRA